MALPTSDINPSDYPGVRIRFSRWATFFGRGWFSRRSLTIFLPARATLAYAQHEYGHYLQLLQLPRRAYSRMKRASFFNALFHPRTHDDFWTERDANRRAAAFFGPDSAISRKEKIWPQH